MGYHTYIDGSFSIEPPLTPEQTKELLDFCKQRHNSPPLPWYYCNWTPSEDGSKLTDETNEGSNYNYVEWLEYIVEEFLEPWGRYLNGQVDWEGEENGDSGTIYAKDNQIEAVEDVITNAGPSWAKGE